MGSVKGFKAVTNTSDLLLVWNESASVVEKVIPNSIDIKTGTSYPGKITLQPYAGALVIKTGIILPIYVGALLAKADGSQFQWQSYEEENLHHYLIQGSSDNGKTWQPVAYVPAVGPSNYNVKP